MTSTAERMVGGAATASGASGAAGGAARPRPGLTGRSALVGVLLVAVVATAATVLAMRRTSTTFDEIVLMAGGARGLHTGSFNLAPEHPPLMQYIYGLPIWLAHPHYPGDGTPAEQRLAGHRYRYAEDFFFRVGNDPERFAFLGRLPAALLVPLLVLLVFVYTRRRAGDGAGFLAATLVAFLPDVLAHGGVAYNDLPLAVAYLLAVWALDRAVRQPGAITGAVAGAAVALAVAVKFSGGGVVVAGVLLLLMEATGRWREARWWGGVGVAVLAALVAGYLALVLVYRGDFTLAELQYGLKYTARHISAGYGTPGYLAGVTSTKGWWFFFPLAFLFKTPAALHLLAALALAGLARGSGVKGLARLRGPLRGAWVGLLVFAYFLVTSHLDIGFRYALPALPLACILIAVGVMRLWAQAGRGLRLAIVALGVWYAGSVLSFYPNYLSYTSEYAGGRDRGDELLLDSSLDWGQGLLQLRDWMRAEHVGRVYLAYFGSALPAAYGIDYVPLFSFFPLPPPPPVPAGTPDPQYVVVSATLLHRVYTLHDPFARFRQIEPYRVIGHHLFVFRLHD